jgi:hypothetical protein
MSVTAPVPPLFDLVSEEPWARESRRQAVSTGGPLGPVVMRSLDARQARHYEITLRHAWPVQVKRLQDLWIQTRFGALPMTYVHPEDGTLLVQFEDLRITRRHSSADVARVVVSLVEALGLA